MREQALVLQDRLINFAVQVCRLSSDLPSTPAAQHIAKQMLRCGTSPAPNYGEAQAAESRQDFIHKMRICLKELRELHVWLRLLGRLEVLHSGALEGPEKECNELVAIFTKSVLTATKRARTPSV